MTGPSLKRKFNFIQKSHGFSMIELLVVISAMVIIGVIVFINFGGFEKDQALEKQALDLQTLFRTAQTNSTSRVLCHTANFNGSNAKAGATWFIEIKNNTQIKMGCRNLTTAGGSEVSADSFSSGTPSISSKTYTLNNGVVASSNCILPLIINIAPLYGNVTFANDTSLNPPTGCYAGKQMTITLTNTRNAGSTKSLIIDSGGAIYVQ